MANPPRQKGTRAESACAKWLTDELGVPVSRGPLRGNQDRGDLFGIPNWTVEIKNCKTPNLKEWRKELAAETRNNGTTRGVVLWSPPGVGMAKVADWVAVEYDPPGPLLNTVPFIGTLAQLPKFVTLMDGWGFTYTVRREGDSWACMRSTGTWLYHVREQIAAAA